MKDKFLPIGSVVLLKGGKKELMITCYCVFPNGEMLDGKERKDVYEYGACLYPEGIMNVDTMYTFDHNQIDKICHLGYETESQKELSEALNKTLEEYKKNKKKNKDNNTKLEVLSDD